MKDTIQNFRFAWKYAKNEKLKLIAFAICNVISIVISVILPIISAKVIVALTDNKLQQVIWMALVIFGIEMLRNVINFLVRYFSQVTYRETFTRLQYDLGKSVLRLENQCLDNNSSGVFIQRITNDTSKIADIFNVLSLNLMEVLTDIGIFGALLVINWKIFIYVVFMVLVIGYVERKRVIVRNQKDKVFRSENENVSGFIGELVRGVRDIKMLSAEKSFLKEFDQKLIHLNHTRYDMSRSQRNFHFLTGTLRDLFDFSIIVLLVWFISKNQMSIAVALVVYNYMGRITYIVNNYSYLLDGVKDFNLSCSRIFEIIYGKNYPKEKFGKTHIDKVKGNFQFKNVSFGYKKEELVLKDLSFRVKANSTVAFVGKSGVGKTTIFNLLCRMYDATSGLITIDGVDIRELDRDSIRSNVTIISQNPYIFNVSIRDNLRFVKEDLTEEEMREACRAACLEEFIEALPDKYDTIVGEGGVLLSGGQRQRLAIARALVQKTEIILFDEATSALDNVTQMKIQQAIENLKEDYTILIIAHRLSTIIGCDRILFLEDGKVSAEGSHEELLKTCSSYKNLYDAEIEK